MPWHTDGKSAKHKCLWRLGARDNAEQGDMMYNLETKLWKSCSSKSVCASLHGIDHDIYPPKFDDGFDVRELF